MIVGKLKAGSGEVRRLWIFREEVRDAGCPVNEDETPLHTALRRMIPGRGVIIDRQQFLGLDIIDGDLAQHHQRRRLERRMTGQMEETFPRGSDWLDCDGRARRTVGGTKDCFLSSPPLPGSQKKNCQEKDLSEGPVRRDGRIHRVEAWVLIRYTYSPIGITISGKGYFGGMTIKGANAGFWGDAMRVLRPEQSIPGKTGQRPARHAGSEARPCA